MAKAPKCKLCGQAHWHPPCPVTEPVTSVTPAVTNVTRRVTSVTPSVTPVTGRVTYPDVTADVTYTPNRFLPGTRDIPRYIASEQEMILAAVDPQHECPICGLLHHRPASNAERQAAYRQRRKGEA